MVTAFLCPKNLSANQPPMMGVKYTNPVKKPYIKLACCASIANPPSKNDLVKYKIRMPRIP
ncbi:MAG: hypothetical protein BWY08_01319 [Bacteroidetes bacterium ADurb.Bin174]|nr:MAG: hypothetical protein BWY08_01319 [Bacteroidetes bacterium ADurb.Bin174]